MSEDALHQECQRLLHLESSADPGRALLVHLAECEGCRRLAEGVARLDMVVATLETCDTDADLRERLVAQVRRHLVN